MSCLHWHPLLQWQHQVACLISLSTASQGRCYASAGIMASSLVVASQWPG